MDNVNNMANVSSAQDERQDELQHAAVQDSDATEPARQALALTLLASQILTFPELNSAGSEQIDPASFTVAEECKPLIEREELVHCEDHASDITTMLNLTELDTCQRLESLFHPPFLRIQILGSSY